MAADSGSLGIGEGSARQREREQILQLPQAGPWRRFFARATDMFLLSAPTAVAVIAFLDWLSPNSISWLLRPGFEYLFAFLLLPVVLLVEAVIFRVFGNTFGKMVFGVFVVSNFGNPLSLDGYILRQSVNTNVRCPVFSEVRCPLSGDLQSHLLQLSS